MHCAETGCKPDRLLDGGVHVVERRPENWHLPQHRKFPRQAGRLSVVTLGSGAVISVDAADLEWANSAFAGMDRDQLMLGTQIATFADRAARNRLLLYGPFTVYTCPENRVSSLTISEPYEIELIKFYDGRPPEVFPEDLSRFPHALGASPDHNRPEMLAAIARMDGAPVGVAAVSRDSEFMWQVGIDVLPAHRRQGLAAALTSAVTRAVLDAGAVPYYACSNTNIPSMKTALAAGFRPMWVELLTKPI